jgi:hypothetical protein
LAPDLARRLGPDVAVRLVATDGLGEWRAGAADAEDQLVEARGGDLVAWLLGRPGEVPNAPDITPWQ